jgi:tetratricopeptide (TPR) repeat protein
MAVARAVPSWWNRFVVLAALGGCPTIAGALSTAADRARRAAAFGPEQSVREEAMGGALVGAVDDVSAAFANPAALNRLSRNECLLSRTDAPAVRRQYAAVAFPAWWRGRRRTLGASVAFRGNEAFDVVENEQPLGRARPSSGAESLVYAQTLGGLSVGGSLHALHQRLFTSRTRALALDVGVAGDRGALSWGAALRRWGPPARGASRAAELPTALAMGAGFRWERRRRAGFQDGILTALSIDAPAGDLVFPRLGLEYGARWDRWRLALRAGYRADPGVTASDRPVFGWGLETASFSLDFSWAQNAAAGEAGRFDARWRFGVLPAGEVRRRALWARTRSLMEEGRLVKARESLEELLVLSPHDGQGIHLARQLDRRFAESLEPETLFHQGYRSFETGDVEQAADLFRKLLVIQPNHADAREWMAKCDARLERLRGERIRSEVERARGRELESIVKRARGRMERRDWEGALAEWRRALSLQPQHPEARREREVCRAGLYAQAEASNDPVEALALYRLSADGERRFQDADARIARLERTVREGPSHSRQWSQDVSFEYGQSDVGGVNILEIRRLAESMQAFPDARLLIEGFADVAEPNADALARARAMNVAEALMNKYGLSSEIGRASCRERVS